MTSRSAVSGVTPARYPPPTAPAIEGGAIHAKSRQFTRPARTCPVAAAVAATPEMAMFAAPAAAGDDATRSTTGKRISPRTRPSAPPARATRKDHPATATSSTGDRASTAVESLSRLLRDGVAARPVLEPVASRAADEAVVARRRRSGGRRRGRRRRGRRRTRRRAGRSRRLRARRRCPSRRRSRRLRLGRPRDRCPIRSG